MIDSGPDVDI